MTIKKMRLPGGVELSPENIEGVGGVDLTRDGEIATDNSDNELKVRLDGVTETIVTEDQVQVLTNKTIDADLNIISELEVDNLKVGVLNTSTTLSGASDSDIPSALAVKTYIDDKAAAQNEASEIIFDPTASGLSATNVQDAIDEVEARVDTAESDIIDNATAISDHITDIVDAHDASAISSIPSGNLSATDVQTALNELQSDIDTNISGISNHISNATDAHDASAISSIPSGNLAATEVQAALDELQSDIDTRASATGLSDHISDTANPHTVTKAQVNLGNVDNTSDATKDAATATLTNKTITGASIQTPTRLDVKQDTKANLITYALTATNGQVVFATDSKEYLSVVDNTLSSLGGGTGSLTSIFQLKADELISTWSTGNNATFLTAGSIAGTFVYETSTPLHGAASYKYTQAAGSLNDWIASAAQPVDLRFRGQQTFLSFPYQYNGNTSDIQVILYDVTNSAILNPSEVIVGNNGATSNTIYSVIIPLTCASIRVGFQVKVLNSGKIFSFDDLQFGSNVADFGNIKTTEVEAIEALTATSTFGATNTGVPVFTITKNTNKGIIRVDSSAAAGTSFVALKDCNVSISSNGGGAGTATLSITRNATILTATAPDNTLGLAVAVSGNSETVTANVALVAGDVLRVQRDGTNIGGINHMTLTATADNNATSSPTQQVSSDTMSFNFKATAINPATDAIGTFNTYTYAASTNTATIAASAPTQTVASMNVNGVQVFARAGNATSTAASPARVDIFIGKGLQSTNLSLFKSAAKSIIGTVDYTQADGKLDAHGCRIKEYNPTTGILQIDAGAVLYPASSTYHTFQFSDNTEQNNGYFVFNASKSPSLVTIPNLAPRIATLSDVKTSGTVGGTGSTSFITRALNTLVDPTGIVTSLAANQFVLTAGEYYIEATCPTYSGVAAHKAKIRNVTDSTDALIGSSAFSTTSQGSFCNIVGVITITSSKTFEIQHRMQASLGTNDLGQACSFGINEVYSQLKITKVK